MQEFAREMDIFCLISRAKTINKTPFLVWRMVNLHHFIVCEVISQQVWIGYRNG